MHDDWRSLGFDGKGIRVGKFPNKCQKSWVAEWLRDGIRRLDGDEKFRTAVRGFSLLHPFPFPSPRSHRRISVVWGWWTWYLALLTKIVLVLHMMIGSLSGPSCDGRSVSIVFSRCFRLSVCSSTYDDRLRVSIWSFSRVPADSRSRGGDVAVYVWCKPTELAHSFLFCSCVCFCLYCLFNSISLHKFSRQRSVFWLCSSGLISTLLVISTVYPFMKVSFNPNIIPSGWLDSKHQ